ncbi:MAG: A/G-specific adenine glycosylase [Bacteroidia bacterium]|nr:A/G-specific adenine glycosylase [Bacteroidia bacterium]
MRKQLIDWYKVNQRNLPWRNTTDPYKIWISEIILQQTRVSQGTDYYYRFIEKFPDISTLAAASEEEVMKVWQGLGYYTRARNLHHTAKTIINEYSGIFPSDYDEILKLKGIGPNTAAAVSSFAFKTNKPVMDGNVVRIVSRLFGVLHSVNSSVGRTIISNYVSQLMNQSSPDMFNQAIMDFGALCCTPSKPGCKHCPFNRVCYAYLHDRIEEFPVRKKKTEMKSRFFNYLDIRSQGFTYIKKRTNNDIWKNLYEYPLIETKSDMLLQDVIASDAWAILFNGIDTDVYGISSEYLHQLTHRRIKARFIRVVVNSQQAWIPVDYTRIKSEDIINYPVSGLMAKYIKEVVSA